MSMKLKHQSFYYLAFIPIYTNWDIITIFFLKSSPPNIIVSVIMMIYSSI